MTKMVIAVLLWLSCVAVYAEVNNLDVYLDTIYKKAEQAIVKEDIKKADFWLARYLGFTVFNNKTEKSINDLFSLFEKRGGLAPTSFISGVYDREFLEFFIHGSHLQWRIAEAGISEDENWFEVETNIGDKYAVALRICPRLEGWLIIKKEQEKAILTLGENPYIISGIVNNGRTVKDYGRFYIDTQGRFIQHFWEPEFHDLDNDNIPEIWIRYNAAQANGFSQVLDIYKIKDDKELILFKRLEGLREGIARRLKDGRVETAEGFAESSNKGHLGYDKHRIKTWEYKRGKFIKVSEKVAPHILHSAEWKRYYFK